MSGEFHPADRFLGHDRQDGRGDIDDLLKRRSLSLDHIVTSRDPGWDGARAELYREGMPPGWETWQVPVYLLSGISFFFLTASAPGAVLPVHAHDVAQLRFVVSGALIYTNVERRTSGELKSGDWMYIPAKAEYTLTASLNPGGCIHYYAY